MKLKKFLFWTVNSTAVFTETTRESRGSHGPGSLPASASSLPHNGISSARFGKFDGYNSIDGGVCGCGQACARGGKMCTCASLLMQPMVLHGKHARV